MRARSALFFYRKGSQGSVSIPLVFLPLQRRFYYKHAIHLDDMFKQS